MFLWTWRTRPLYDGVFASERECRVGEMLSQGSTGADTSVSIRARRVPSWARKTLVAVLAIGSFLLDYYVQDSGSLAASLTLGLLVGILASIFETQFSIVDSAASSHQLLVDNQRRIENEVGDVSRLNKVRDRIQTEFGNRFFVNEVLDYEWKRFQDRLDSLANGSLKSDNFVSLISAAAAHEECRSILGVTTLPSVIGDGNLANWWLSRAGQEYSQLNFAVAARIPATPTGSDRRVERIWVYRDPRDLQVGSNVELLREHADNGIGVRIYRWQKDSMVPNFTIWNHEDKGRQAAWEATLNWDGQMIAGTFYASPEEIKRLQDEWRRLRRDSQVWRDPIARADGATLLAIVPAIDDPSAPRLEEVARGVRLDRCSGLTVNLFPLQLDSRASTSGRLNVEGIEPPFSDEPTQVEVVLQISSSEGSEGVAGNDEPTPPANPSVLGDRDSGYLLVRRRTPVSRVWAVSQEVEVYPVRWSPPSSLRNGLKLMRNGDPYLEARITSD